MPGMATGLSDQIPRCALRHRRLGEGRDLHRALVGCFAFLSPALRLLSHDDVASTRVAFASASEGGSRTASLQGLQLGMPSRASQQPHIIDGHGRRAALLLGTSSMTAASASALAAVPQPAARPLGGGAVQLGNGLAFPTASFGLQVYDDATGQQLTELALSVGYRNFFASVLAGNQKGFARGVKASGVPREEMFICGSVLSNSASGFESAYQATKRGCRENLEAFAVGGIDYVDMIMLDYPGGDCESIRGQWRAFEEMYKAGKTRSLAVSNFSPEQLDCILQGGTTVAPVVNQLPYSVRSHDAKAVEENTKRGVVVQAWSPLKSGQPSLFANKVCEEIGKSYGKSAAQVALRWIVQSGATFTTQTKSRDHFVEDLNIFDFQLSEAEMQRLGAISGSPEGQADAVLGLALPVGAAIAAGLAVGQLGKLARKKTTA